MLCTEERCKADADSHCCCSEQKDDPDEEKLAREMKEFGDIVRIDMVDTYADLSMKTMRMFSALPQKVRGVVCNFTLNIMCQGLEEGHFGWPAHLALSHAQKAAGGFCYGTIFNPISGIATWGCPRIWAAWLLLHYVVHPGWLSIQRCPAEKVLGRSVTTVSALHCKQQIDKLSAPLLLLNQGAIMRQSLWWAQLHQLIFC